MKRLLTVLACVLLLTMIFASCAEEVVTVVGAHINEDGELVIEMSNGINRITDVVKGDKGDKGDRGDRGPIGEKGEDGTSADKLDTHLISERVLQHTVRIANCTETGVEVSSGSGVIYAKNEGVYTVITNEHVIKGASIIKVKTYDGKVHTATVVTRSAAKDIAVLSFSTTEAAYPGAFQGDSRTLKRGQEIFVAGNPVGNEFVVSYGHISNPSSTGKWETYDVQDVIVLDASVNKGNSGGGVYDEYGRLIGIVTAKAGGETDGIGYAIPMYTVNAIVDNDIGLEELFGKPTLGIKVIHIHSPEQYAAARSQFAVLGEILPDTTDAEEIKNYHGVYVVDTLDSALRKGDRIISIDDKEVVEYTDVAEILAVYTPGSTVEVVVKRIESDGSIQRDVIEATLSEIPS